MPSSAAKVAARSTGCDAATIDAGSEGRSVEAERHVAVVGPGAEVGGAAARWPSIWYAARTSHDVPAAVGGVAVGQHLAQFAGRDIGPSRAAGACSRGTKRGVGGRRVWSGGWLSPAGVLSESSRPTARHAASTASSASVSLMPAARRLGGLSESRAVPAGRRGIPTVSTGRELHVDRVVQLSDELCECSMLAALMPSLAASPGRARRRGRR